MLTVVALFLLFNRLFPLQFHESWVCLEQTVVTHNSPHVFVSCEKGDEIGNINYGVVLFGHTSKTVVNVCITKKSPGKTGNW